MAMRQPQDVRELSQDATDEQVSIYNIEGDSYDSSNRQRNAPSVNHSEETRDITYTTPRSKPLRAADERPETSRGETCVA